MKKMKYILILLSCTELIPLYTKNIDEKNYRVIIPSVSLKVSEEMVEAYLDDTVGDRNEQDIENKKKKFLVVYSLSFLNRVKTFAIICKEYIDLLKDYVASSFKKT